MQNTLKPTIPSIVEYREKDNTILEVTYKGALLKTKPPNDMVLLRDDITVLKITKFIRTERNDEQNVAGNVIPLKRSIYSYPSDSSVTDMWEIETENQQFEINVPINQIKCKLMHLVLNFEPHLQNCRFAVGYLHQM